jgi:hypothetical protein
MIREGHLSDLLQLADIALTKNMPSRFFAKSTRTTPEPGKEGLPTNWERTLETLAKLREVAEKAVEVMERICASKQQIKAVYKACWRSQDVIRHAITAQETGRDKFKYFCWLVWGNYERPRI